VCVCVVCEGVCVCSIQVISPWLAACTMCMRVCVCVCVCVCVYVNVVYASYVNVCVCVSSVNVYVCVVCEGVYVCMCVL